MWSEAVGGRKSPHKGGILHEVKYDWLINFSGGPERYLNLSWENKKNCFLEYLSHTGLEWYDNIMPTKRINRYAIYCAKWNVVQYMKYWFELCESIKTQMIRKMLKNKYSLYGWTKWWTECWPKGNVKVWQFSVGWLRNN